MNGDRLPVSRGLIIALVLGFGLFNEMLFTALAAATAAEGKQDQANLIGFVALGLGGLLTAACIGFLVTASARRITDGIVVVAAVAMSGGSIWRGWPAGTLQTGWWWLALNGVLTLWLARGWLRRAWQRRKSRGERDD